MTELLARARRADSAPAPPSCAIRLDGRFELRPRPLGPAPDPALPAR